MITLKSATVERWPVRGAFTISRGAKTDVDVVVVEVTDGTHVGRGEGTPIYYEGETAALCVESVEMRCRQNRALSRDDLLKSMAEGAARNALDCALWDLEAKQSGKPVWQLAGLPEPRPFPTAYTISLGDPAQMEADARAAVAASFGLLKCKLTGAGDRERIAAVRRGAPEARIIVDANESWEEVDIEDEAAAMAALGVELIEQPVPAGEEDLLEGVHSAVPFCADESCHTHEDIERLDGYRAVNIKLDKAGGLTEAIALANAARARGLDIMIGCMLGTSLGIAPAALLAGQARWVDLDGALLLAKDRKGGLIARDGLLMPGTLWGLPA